jgi:methylthioribose-1-phosphate isomerase
MSAFQTLEWRDGVLRMLDQRQLPHKVIYLDFTDVHQVAAAIQDMVVRGAPAIGASAAWGLALVVERTSSHTFADLLMELQQAAEELRIARPTAVNLSYAIDRVMRCASELAIKSIAALKNAVLEEAQRINDEDVRTNQSIAHNAQVLVPDPAVIITHCNAGALATVDYGTALGVIRMAHELGKHVLCLVDETRPRLQGARLTAWELIQYGIPFKVIVDGASGHFMRTRGVDLCIVGCDRVASNGDTANKIGTYNLALAAQAHSVPFYVACPTTTIDLACPTGEQIQIEERPADEITHLGDCQITPDDVLVANPAFDVTPAKYITAILTENGIAYPPYEQSLASMID